MNTFFLCGYCGLLFDDDNEGQRHESEHELHHDGEKGATFHSKTVIIFLLAFFLLITCNTEEKWNIITLHISKQIHSPLFINESHYKKNCRWVYQVIGHKLAMH